jgi:glycosyltransferase involved in cell wall biosynthesis
LNLVSVITPVWRPRQDWLHQCVNSVLSEQSCDVELILVDDGNDTPISELLTDIRDSRLRVIRVAHCGPYAARNAGLKEARGEFVRFVDSDDTVEPGSIGRLLQLALSCREETSVYGATMICDADLKPRRLVSETSEGYAAKECLLGGFNVYVVSILYPRPVLDRAGPWEERQFRVSGDWDYVLRVLEQAPVRRLDEVVSHYRRNAESVSRSARVADGLKAGELVLDRYFERHPEHRRSSLHHRAYANLHLHGARLHWSGGERRAAARQIARAARHRPIAAISTGLRFAAKWLRGFAARAAGIQVRKRGELQPR